MILKAMLAAAGLYLLLSPVRVEAQTPSAGYDAKWAIVDSLAHKAGLPQSALKEINSIYTLARQEHNDAQQIKALVYRIVEENATRENDDTTAIKELEAAAREAAQPARSILRSLTAGAYWHYFQLNRYKIYNRTATVNFVKADIATWTTGDFQHAISTLYLESLQAAALLKRIPLQQYEPILIKGNVRYLRPTLFDLLAHEALSYFVSSETTIRQPANVFEIDDEAIFADAAVFAAHSFSAGDTASVHYKALQLFQQLISFHLSDARPDALIDVDISRLDFARDYGVMEDKDEEYQQALAHITARYGDLPAAAQAWYLQAEADHTAAEQSKKFGDITANSGNIRAKAICEKVLAEKDSSEGKSNCQSLMATILQKKLSLQAERVNMPGKPMRSLVSWSNFTRLYLRLVRTDSLPQLRVRYATGEDYWDRLLRLPVYRSFVQELPATGDYLEHSTEIAIGSLPPGVYTLIGCADAGWSRGHSVMTEATLYVSAIAFINQGRDYFIVNRETGQPLSGANVQIWGRTFVPPSGTERLEKRELYHTDAQGYVQLRKREAQEDFEQQFIDISFGGDRLFMTDAAITTPFAPKPNLKPIVYFFLDRSIYRPGQTIYFKGITITRDSGDQQHTVWGGRKAKLTLYNTNGEKVDELPLTTDEFGAYHGTFRLPEHQLNGVWRITDEGTGSSTSFSVEEYKRPSFYVDFEKPKGSYRVGDSIRVKGNAKAFAGNNLDGVKVKYRVVRQVRLPHFWLSWRSVAPFLGGSQEIAHGELTTDANGAFRLAFAALPDRHMPVTADPRFEYRVEADITDINGETRSGSTWINAGYTVLNLSIVLPDNSRMTADSLQEFTVRANNLSGEPVSSTVHVAAYPLQSPTRLIRERLWAAPDTFVIPETTFLDSFPHDEYRDDLTREKWARGPLAWEAMDSTLGNAGERSAGGQGTAIRVGGQAQFHIPAGRLSAGWWVIEATATDSGGRTVKDLQYVELYDSKTGRPATPEYNWAGAGPTTMAAEPGGKARVEAGSSAADVYVIRQIERPGKHFGSFDYFTLSNSKNAAEWTITAADRGGIGIADAFVKDNRLYSHKSVVQVPWTNKELQIHYTTYRDKTEPGSEEKWGVTISGYKSEQVSASVLTAMYDASLDAFKPHSWRAPNLFPMMTRSGSWTDGQNFQEVFSSGPFSGWVQAVVYSKEYDKLLSIDPRLMLVNGKLFKGVLLKAMPGVQVLDDGNITAQGENLERVMVDGKAFAPEAKFDATNDADVRVVIRGTGLVENRGEAEGEAPPPEVPVRKNFNETAFFLPDLRTDNAGNVSWSFTMPEALTQWKWMTLAYTRDLAFGYSEKTIVTQKKLMVQPNVPRYLREGDRMNLSVKVVNLTDSEMTGQTALALTDPTTGETADGWFVNRQPNQYFTVAAHSSVVVDFPLDIPFQYNRPLTYRITAQSGNYSDGEEATLPVVSNRMLVTETLPLNMSGDGTRAFHFDKLLQSGSSETLNHHALTVEFTTNPTWYAIQSLPYLMEYPYECAEQTFERLYANALASKIVNSSPRIAQVFSAWRTSDTAALLSNLEKNPELKSILLEETPWVLQGKTETQQKKNIALLFEMDRMSGELEAAIDRLKEIQAADGGFPWFKGGTEDQYVTQYILTGIAHLRLLKALPDALKEKINTMVMAALIYVDRQILAEYQRDLKADGERGAGGGAGGKGAGAAANGVVRVVDYLPVQYLYMRSMFNDYGIPGDIFPAVNYYRKQVQKGWLQENRFMQGMIALALFRTGDVQTARNIIASLRQNAMHDEEKGMWWKDMEGGYYWYQAPIETQSLLIEAFREISGDAAVDRELKTWLLRQKQTHSWKTTVATADACYALMMGADNWLGAERAIVIKLGDKTINWTEGERTREGAADTRSESSVRGTAGRETAGIGGPLAAGGAETATRNDTAGQPEAGTGYYKKIFDAPFINPSMGNITVTMQTKGGGGPPAWGAVYWQYFDQLDQITGAGGSKSPLRLTKRLFVQRNTDHGPVLDTIPDNGSLKVGDRVVVRIELRADRDLEYVHMKDMRGACLEPVDVLSAYKWQGGLGYYETTKDASTEFFFPEVRRGTYVFEYTLIAGQTGNFSNGIASVECMYAPEFAYHSEGIRINVEGAP
jgi:Bacterial Alpha-2-macroglobulin MG10 domain/Alpha-2-macroglobulin family/MG2 domain